MGYYGYRPYVSQAERKAKAQKKADSLAKKGQKTSPISLAGRTIASTFWGKSWCSHLESYSDFSNRLPRGRTYVRNGSVIDLQVKEGIIQALVSGSAIYSVKIEVSALEAKTWQTIIKNCSSKVISFLDLLQGKLSSSVMEVVTDKQNGLFPKPKELKFSCSCPDWASMCKHVAASLYGFGARLDETPEILFKLRKVDHNDLISIINTEKITKNTRAKKIADDDLSSLFGIELDNEPKKTIKKAIKKTTKETNSVKKDSKKISKSTTAKSPGKKAGSKKVAK